MIMKGTNLGELEELVLLVIANLKNDAYGLSIKKYIMGNCNRSVSISTVHATLHRLEKKGYLRSEYDNSQATERGGRPKLIFSITTGGGMAIKNTKDLRIKLWSTATQWSTE